MGTLSLESVFYTCIFLLPGFIIKSILNLFVREYDQGEIRYFLSCLSFSIVNWAVWSWGYLLVISSFKFDIVEYYLALVFITVIGSFLLGVVLGVVRQKKLIQIILESLGIHTMDPDPTAWDYCFADARAPWIKIVLKNGTEVLGIYAGPSLASSDVQHQDIYVEPVYQISDSGEWAEEKDIKGILITQNEISTITFLKGEEKTKGVNMSNSNQKNVEKITNNNPNIEQRGYTNHKDVYTNPPKVNPSVGKPKTSTTSSQDSKKR